MFTRIVKKSLSEGVFEQIRAQIIHGDFNPGDTLPSERALCKLFGVNRGAVREALKRLEQAQLIRIQQGGATKILDYKESAGIDLLPALLSRNETLDPQVVRSVVELRSALGNDIVRLCAQRASDQLAVELLDLTRAMTASKGDLRALEELNVRFWGLLVRGSNNIAYQLAYNALRSIFAKLRHSFRAMFSIEWQNIAAMEAIALAVREKSGADAQTAVDALLNPTMFTLQDIAAPARVFPEAESDK